jgi:ribosomal protein S27AE
MNLLKKHDYPLIEINHKKGTEKIVTEKKNSGNAIMHSSPANRRCPRCGGNLFFDQDYRGWYLECLQCSYTRELEIKVGGK